MPLPNMSFPDRSERNGCSHWCRPLHLIDKAIAGQHFAKYFDIDHFMCMGKVHRRPRPDVILYKHGHTRRYLNLDEGGHAYRFIPPPPGSRSHGQYRLQPDLIAAIDALHLYEMPWLAGSGFDGDRRGLGREDRWDHPEVIAWYERDAARTAVRRRPARRMLSR